MNKTFRVFNNDDHEYDIVIDVSDIHEYSLITKGSSWSEDCRNRTVLKITNDGNGYRFPKIGKKMDYAQMLQWSIMTNFINHYESQAYSHITTITIESCKEKLRFTI